MERQFTFVLAFALLSLAARCQEGSIVTKVEFISGTRGYQKQVFYSADSVITQITSRGEIKSEKRKIDSLEWESLQNAVAEVELQKVNDLRSPTTRRAFDGARHAAIIIYTKDGRSYNHSFDDENPHEDLVGVMDAIKKISGSQFDEQQR